MAARATALENFLAKLDAAGGLLDAAEAKQSVAEANLAEDPSSDKAKQGVAEAKQSIAKAELGVAKAELGVAEANLAEDPSSDKAKQSVAEAKLGVAEAKLGVAEAKLGVAKAELVVAKADWESAEEGPNKDILKKLMDGAQKSVDVAQDGVRLTQKAYEKLLDTAQGARADTDRKEYLMVTAKVEGARRMQGIRAAVYMRAEKHCARYYLSKNDSFRYQDDNLHICVLFLPESQWNAENFQSSLKLWHVDNPLIGLEGKVLVKKQISVVKQDVSERVYLSDYVAADGESPMSSLADFKASVSSCETASVGMEDDLVQFQCVENPQCFATLGAYELHIKDKAKCTDLKYNANNLLAGSWTPFHHYFDGLRTPGNLPQVAIRYVKDNGQELVGDPPTKRQRVEIALEFRDSTAEGVMAPRLKTGSRKLDNLEWLTFVHVENATEFKKCLDWKYDKTKNKWKDFDEI